MSLKSKGGFTLIELLVAISIIAIVFGIIITSAGAIQKAGRDTQRKADLRNLQSALQNYYTDNNSYPASFNALLSPKAYISNIPKDPSTGTDYYYLPLQRRTDTTSCSASCHYYNLCAKLENADSGASCSNTAYNYQLTPIN